MGRERTASYRGWQPLDIDGHAALVDLCFEQAGFGRVPVDALADGRAEDLLLTVMGRA
jgi:hypothetical protein